MTQFLKSFPATSLSRLVICILFATASLSFGQTTLRWDPNANQTGGSGTWEKILASPLSAPWLNQTNVYQAWTTGPFTASFEFGASNTVSNGTVTISGNIDNLGTATFSKSYTLTGISNSNSGTTGTLIVNSGVNLFLFENNFAGASLTLSSIQGSGQVIIQGTASSVRVVSLNNNSTISAATQIAGTGDGRTGYILNASGTNQATISGNITTNQSRVTQLGAGDGDTLNFSGGFAGTGSVLFSTSSGAAGAGTINLSGTSSHTGNTLFNLAATGVVRVIGNNRLSANSVLDFANGTLDLNGTSQTVAGLTGSVGRGIVNTTGTGTIQVNVAANQSHTYGGAIGVPTNTTNIANANNNIAFVKDGAGTQVLSGTNTFMGGTTVLNGTLRVSGGNALANSGAVTVNGSIAVFDVTTSETIGTLNLTNGTFSSDDAATLTATSANLSQGTVTGNLNSTTTSKLTGGMITFQGSTSNLGNLTMDAGTINVANNSALTVGTFDFNGGSLTVEAGSSLTAGTNNVGGTSNVVVDGTLAGNVNLNGTSKLSGIGSITGDVSVGATATLSPGNSPGILTLNGDLTLNGTYDFEAGDLVLVTGDITLAAGSQWNLLTSGPFNDGDQLVLFGYTTGNFVNNGMLTPANWTISSITGSFQPGFGNYVIATFSATAIPEPTALLLVGSALAFGGLRRRRKLV